MLTKKIEDILNLQVEREAYSSNLYLAMASWGEVKGYSGVAQWLYAQADEERMHMLKFIEYINDRGGHAIISALEPNNCIERGFSASLDSIIRLVLYES